MAAFFRRKSSRVRRRKSWGCNGPGFFPRRILAGDLLSVRLARCWRRTSSCAAIPYARTATDTTLKRASDIIVSRNLAVF